MPSEIQGQYRRVLIDCGHSSERNWYPGTHLRNLGISYVDMLICTNYDEDHASGAVNLVEKGINIGCILGNPTVPPAVIEHLKSEDGMGNGIKVIVNTLAERAAKGQPQVPPNIQGLDVYRFWNPWPHWDTENNLSLVTHLNIRGFKFLFPGDMESDGFRNLLGYKPFADLMGGIDVLIAAHHGRENGKCSEMFDVHNCSPQLVLISDCAKKFQSQETVPYYQSKAKGIGNFRKRDGRRYVLTTRSDGEIQFLFSGDRCFVL